MKVNVRIFGSVVEVVGRSHSLELSKNATMNTLITKIAEKSGQPRNGYLDEFKVGGADLAVILNGKNIAILNGLDTILSDKDDVVIMPFVFGG